MPYTKQQHIALYKRQVKAGEEMMQVSQQNYETAARLVSEAKSALEELGAPKGQARKGKNQLPDALKLKLTAGLTKLKSKDT